MRLTTGVDLMPKEAKNISENSRKVHHSLGWSGFHVPLVLGKRPAPGKLVDPGWHRLAKISLCFMWRLAN